jgi:anthranilate phosphoribosyltransferase
MLAFYLEKVESRQALTEAEASDCLTQIFNTPEADEDHIVRFLLAMRQKGESLSELVGFAKTMRKNMQTVNLPQPVMDVCGTGGSQKARFNVSTSSAFVLAAKGIPIAKHGNYGSKSPNGSFDFLSALHIPFGQNEAELHTQFNHFNLCFLLARHHHPLMKNVASARKKAGSPTFFNLLGPLCNPAFPSHQIIGTPTPENAEKLAHTLLHLGTKSSLVICPTDGRDELSLTHPSHIYHIHENQIAFVEFDPKCLKLSPFTESDLEMQDATQSADVFLLNCRNGSTKTPIVHWIALNAGAGLFNFGKAPDILTGYQMALEAWAQKEVWAYFESFPKRV